MAVRDIGEGLLRLPLAANLALEDVHGRYRRTVLGPLWITLRQAATIAGFILVFSSLFGMDPANYALYLAAGFPVWTLISQYLSDMPLTFLTTRGYIESFNLPWTLHIWRRSIAYLLTFLHHLVILAVVMAWLGVTPRTEMLYAAPALVIVAVAGAGLGLLLAVLGARYRDLQPAMVLAAGFLFMFSPVMWRPEQLQVNTWVVEMNPLAYFIRLVRDPLLGHLPPAEIWLGTGVGALALLAAGMSVFSLARSRLYHWL